MRIKVVPALKEPERAIVIIKAGRMLYDIRRLQQWAESEDVRDAALECNAAALKCEEVIDGWWNPKSWPSRIYRVSSNYGRSISRPLCLAAISTLLSLGIFVSLCEDQAAASATALDVFRYNIMQLIPLPGLARGIEAASLVNLLGISQLDAIDRLWWSMLSIWQGLIGLLSLFLVGLAVRNRFKIG